MPLPVTEELLSSLGFVKRDKYTWDYVHNNDPQYIRFYRVYYSNTGNLSGWYLRCDGMSNECPDFMAFVLMFAEISHARGVRETQDKIHDAIGLNRLAERLVC